MKWRDLWTTSFKENDILAFQPQIWHLAFSAEAVRREAPTIDMTDKASPQLTALLQSAALHIKSRLNFWRQIIERVESKKKFSRLMQCPAEKEAIIDHF